MKKILAKSKDEKKGIKEQTLLEHNEALLKVLERIKPVFTGNIIEEKKLKLLCLIHDLGKINSKFQEKIDLANQNNNKWKDIKDKRHNLLSGAFLKQIFDQIDLNEKEKSILYKAVLLHHGYYEKYLDINNAEIEKSVYEDIEKFLVEQKEEYNFLDLEKDLQRYFQDLGLNFNLSNLGYDFMFQLNENFGEDHDNKPKLKYILYKGFLNLIDHLASSQIENFNYFSSLNDKEIDSKLETFLGDKFESFSELQNKLRNLKNKNILTIAFTGSGKTIADYRWSGNRKLFLVPTRISGESFYFDSFDIFGEENVGLLHGDINLYESDFTNIERGEDIQISLKDIELARNLAKPYLISTIDQILLAMFKYPGYEKLFAQILGSKITVDEVHLLTPKMFLMLIYFMQFAIKNLGCKFHLMTATMPEFYKDKLENALPDCFEESNKDNEKINENRKRVRLEFIKTKKIDEIIRKAVENNKSILIIKNTIDSAIQEYQEIFKKYQNVKLLHSRFKLEHKQDKYKELLDNKIVDKFWITTQMVEVSLDLDFEIIISDLAPMDSIIQRMGRCNRHDKIEYGNFYIIDEDNDEKVYDKDLKDETKKILKKIDKQELSMGLRQELLQEFYKTEKVAKYYKDEFKKANKSIKKIFDIKEKANIEFNGDDIVFNYEPYLNIVDNKKEAEALFRDGVSIKIFLEEDFNNELDYKKLQLKAIQISKGIFFALRKENAVKNDRGFFIVREGTYTYDNKNGFQIKEIDTFF